MASTVASSMSPCSTSNELSMMNGSSSSSMNEELMRRQNDFLCLQIVDHFYKLIVNDVNFVQNSRLYRQRDWDRFFMNLEDKFSKVGVFDNTYKVMILRRLLTGRMGDLLAQKMNSCANSSQNDSMDSLSSSAMSNGMSNAMFKNTSASSMPKAMESSMNSSTGCHSYSQLPLYSELRDYIMKEFFANEDCSVYMSAFFNSSMRSARVNIHQLRLRYLNEKALAERASSRYNCEMPSEESMKMYLFSYMKDELKMALAKHCEMSESDLEALNNSFTRNSNSHNSQTNSNSSMDGTCNNSDNQTNQATEETTNISSNAKDSKSLMISLMMQCTAKMSAMEIISYLFTLPEESLKSTPSFNSNRPKRNNNRRRSANKNTQQQQQQQQTLSVQ